MKELLIVQVPVHAHLSILSPWVQGEGCVDALANFKITCHPYWLRIGRYPGRRLCIVYILLTWQRHRCWCHCNCWRCCGRSCFHNRCVVGYGCLCARCRQSQSYKMHNYQQKCPTHQAQRCDRKAISFVELQPTLPSGLAGCLSDWLLLRAQCTPPWLWSGCPVSRRSIH